METFRITFKHHLNNSWTIVIYLIIFTVLPYFGAYKTGMDINHFFLPSLAGFLLFFIPVLIIHINYYIVNKHDEVTYDHQERKIIIKHNGSSKVFKLEDIDHIERFVSFNTAADRLTLFPWEDYHHSIVYFKDGQKVVITSLLIPNLQLPVANEVVYVKKGFFRLAKKY